jgi:hypothetical protein
LFCFQVFIYRNSKLEFGFQGDGKISQLKEKKKGAKLGFNSKHGAQPKLGFNFGKKIAKL